MLFKTQELKAALKALLKKKGITYEQVAEELECSLPTVKRIMGPEELTLSRFIQLCQIADVDLAELEAFATAAGTEDESFTDEQALFLSKHPAHLAYLMKLFHGQTPRQIADEFKLSQQTTDRYLLALEKRGLIRVTGKLKVKPAFKQMPHFGKGPLARSYFETLIGNALKFFVETSRDVLTGEQVKEKYQIKTSFAVEELKITRESFAAWSNEFEATLKSLVKISIFEEKTKAPEELMTAVVLKAECLADHQYPRLKVISNLLGDIPAI
jgi:transcriptional regulator with XRE-family HTH domain